MLRWAVEEHDGPVAVRYPRGGDRGACELIWKESAQTFFCCCRGADVTFITYGTVFFNVLDAADQLRRSGIESTVIRLTEVSVFDGQELLKHISGNAPVIVVEEAAAGCGIHEALSWALHAYAPRTDVYSMDLGGGFITHGKTEQLYKHCGLDADSIVKKVKEVLRNEN